MDDRLSASLDSPRALAGFRGGARELPSGLRTRRTPPRGGVSAQLLPSLEGLERDPRACISALQRPLERLPLPSRTTSRGPRTRYACRAGGSKLLVPSSRARARSAAPRARRSPGAPLNQLSRRLSSCGRWRPPSARQETHRISPHTGEQRERVEDLTKPVLALAQQAFHAHGLRVDVGAQRATGHFAAFLGARHVAWAPRACVLGGRAKQVCESDEPAVLVVDRSACALDGYARTMLTVQSHRAVRGSGRLVRICGASKIRWLAYTRALDSRLTRARRAPPDHGVVGSADDDCYVVRHASVSARAAPLAGNLLARPHASLWLMSAVEVWERFTPSACSESGFAFPSRRLHSGRRPARSVARILAGRAEGAAPPAPSPDLVAAREVVDWRAARACAPPPRREHERATGHGAARGGLAPDVLRYQRGRVDEGERALEACAQEDASLRKPQRKAMAPPMRGLGLGVALVGSLGLAACPAFTPNETVSDPDPVAVRSARRGSRPSAPKPAAAPSPHGDAHAGHGHEAAAPETATASHILIRYAGAMRTTARSRGRRTTRRSSLLTSPRRLPRRAPTS